MFVTLQARLIALLVGVLALIAMVGGAWYTGHRSGYQAGQDKIQKQWDKAIVDARAADEVSRNEGYATAQEYLTRLNKLEKRYERTEANQRAALQQKFICPTSGVVGDIVLPAALVDSMFNRDEPGSAPPEPAATGTHPAVRPGF